MKIQTLVQSSQFAYFLSSIDLSDRLKIAENIRATTKSVLDGQPTILPIPDDAPPEIPRIMLSSKDKRFICNVALNRFDFIHKTTNQDTGMETMEFDDFLLKEIVLLNKLLFTELDVKSHRLGLIITYHSHLEQEGLAYLKSRYFGNPKDKAVELQAHRLTQESIAEMNSNNWIRLVAKLPESEKQTTNICRSAQRC